eukprot:2512359-Pleurochrysis_carterae.AAC.2
MSCAESTKNTILAGTISAGNSEFGGKLRIWRKTSTGSPPSLCGFRSSGLSSKRVVRCMPGLDLSVYMLQYFVGSRLSGNAPETPRPGPSFFLLALVARSVHCLRSQRLHPPKEVHI